MILSLGLLLFNKMSNRFMTPVAKRELKEVILGPLEGQERGSNLMDPPVKLDDYYYWLRSDDRKDKDVLSYLDLENEYTKSVLKENDLHIENMYNEIKSHIQETYDSYPRPHGEGGWESKYRYLTRRVEGKSYPIYCRADKEDNIEELLDINELAKGKTNFDVKGFEVTEDHKLMSYGVDENGSEKYKLTVKNIETYEILSHEIPDLMYCSYFWHKNWIFYEMGDDTNRMYQIWRYNFETKENIMIYENLDNKVSVGISMSMDKKYFFISAGSYNSSETYYFTEDNLEPKLIAGKMDNTLYSVSYHEGKFLIVTNKDDCRNFKIMITDVDSPGVENWKELLPYDENIFIKGIYELKNNLVILFKENGVNRIRNIKVKNDGSYDLDEVDILKLNEDKDITEEDFKDLYFSGLDIYDTNKIWFSHDSLDTPVTLYDYNLDTKERNILREKEVPNFDSSQYESKRVYATSDDGTQVPISIVYKKNLFNKNGSNPLYLYGYGSYGHTVNPDFNTNILPLLNRGFVYAIAHVRGGSFLGYKWYEGGKMKTKMNTFKDFIACAEHLIKEKYTYSKGITIEGRSAGGLLVGASMTMRPDLFHTVIGGVPFVDLLATMSDPSIPLTTEEWEQWGNPNKKEFYDYMKQYSPYDNIKETDYPNILMLAGLNDPRVAYWEPAKFIAKLRYMKTNDNLTLLKTEMDEGHFGGSDRYKYMKELAFSYTFVLKTYNLLIDIYQINYSN